MGYLKWAEEKINDCNEQKINTLYNDGFLFGRNEKNVLYQTRSLRIDLATFELTSENRRILRKTEGVLVTKHSLPYSKYSWEIGKLAKDFYTTKFGEGTFSANKIKELLTNPSKSNFTGLLVYNRHSEQSEEFLKPNHKGSLAIAQDDTEKDETVGYCIILETADLIHYCYPFYKLDIELANLGLGMMLKAIMYAKDQGKKYIYLGSAQRPTDTYKLQFEGLEWFDGQKWQTNFEKLKQLL
jgi:arginyl-tRNA--protein-N-Asp/Glu arginylyltransferase